MTITPPVPPGGPVHSVPGAGTRIALTFDDGVGKDSAAVMQVLREQGVKATFFVNGANLNSQGQKDLVALQHAEGHAVANHTESHDQLTSLGPEQVRAEIRSTNDKIQAITGERPTTFRPPYGAYNPTVNQIAAEEGVRNIMWSIDPRDWDAAKSPAAIRDTILNNAHDGAVILLHDGGGDRARTLAALNETIDGLQAQGYEFVTVPELLTGPGGDTAQ